MSATRVSRVVNPSLSALVRASSSNRADRSTAITDPDGPTARAAGIAEAVQAADCGAISSAEIGTPRSKCLRYTLDLIVLGTRRT